jgi:hypothetical protein
MLFGCVLGSTLAAMWVSRRLPEHHLNSESRDAVKLGLGVIATLTALVLGLLVSATKGTYDVQSGMVKDLAADLAQLDRLLERYGPEAGEARARLRVLGEAVHEQFWPRDGEPVEFTGGPSKSAGEAVFEAIAALEPRSEPQRLLKSRSQEILLGLGHMRQRLAANSERSIPAPLLVALGFWLAVLFAGFGMLAPRNPTTFVVLVVCILSVSGALFLVMELDRPFQGLIRVSDTPLRSALSHMG